MSTICLSPSGGDDTPLIQAAINSGAACVMLAAGCYSINPTGLVGVSNQDIVGENQNATVLNQTGIATNGTLSFTGASGFSVRNLSIQNNSLGGTLTPVISIKNCSHFSLSNFSILNMLNVGLYMTGTSFFTVRDYLISKATAAATQNQAILVSSSQGSNSYGTIDGGVCLNSGMDLTMALSRITGNTITGWMFGSGITTEQDPSCFSLVITGNTIGNSSGEDVNKTYCMGIENWAPRSIITGNIIFSTSGDGIDNGGMQTVVANNMIINPGVSTGSSFGLVASYGNASYNASNSVFIGNVTYGGSGQMSYGYADQNGSLSGVRVAANELINGQHGAAQIVSSSTNYSA